MKKLNTLFNGLILAGSIGACVQNPVPGRDPDQPSVIAADMNNTVDVIFNDAFVVDEGVLADESVLDAGVLADESVVDAGVLADESVVDEGVLADESVLDAGVLVDLNVPCEAHGLSLINENGRLVGTSKEIRLRVNNFDANCSNNFDILSLVNTLRELNPQIPFASAFFETANVQTDFPVDNTSELVLSIGEIVESPFVDLNADGRVDNVNFPNVLRDVDSGLNVELNVESREMIFSPFLVGFTYDLLQVGALDAGVRHPGVFTMPFDISSTLKNAEYFNQQEIVVAENVYRTTFDTFLSDFYFSLPFQDILGALPDDYEIWKANLNAFCAFNLLHFAIERDMFLNPIVDLPTTINIFEDLSSVFYVLIPFGAGELNLHEENVSETSCGVRWDVLNVLDSDGNAITLPNADTNNELKIQISVN